MAQAPERAAMAEAVFAAFCAAEGGSSARARRPTSAAFQKEAAALCVPFTAETVDHLFVRSDSDGDGRLSTDEFAAFADAYPRLIECLYFRLVDRDTLEAHSDAVAQARRSCAQLATALRAAEAVVTEAQARAAEADEAVRRQAGELAQARLQEARERELAESAQYGRLDAREAALVAGALDTGAVGVCAEKREQHYASITEEEMREFARLVMDEWRTKQGDLVDELVTNLRAPEGSRNKRAIIAEAARHLSETKQLLYPHSNRLQLLAMLLYTMAGPDIDALMTYDDAPVYNESDVSQWRSYVEKVGGTRNGAIFGAINWGMRTAADPKQREQPSGAEAWDACKKWIKYICLLMAIAAQHDAESEPPLLARGLAGLPAVVQKSHGAMQSGDKLNWPAASSCALDRRVSESYIRGDAANATKQEGGSILFLMKDARRGVLLQPISKYPKEEEKLVPPLSSFEVEAVRTDDPSLPGSLVIDMVASSASVVPPDFIAAVLEDSERSAERLASALVSHHEAELAQQVGSLERSVREAQAAGAASQRAEREVERYQQLVDSVQRDASSASAKLAELLEQVERQQAEVAKREEALERCRADTADRRARHAEAVSAEVKAKEKVSQQEGAVRAAEEALVAAKRRSEVQRKEAAEKVSAAQTSTREVESKADLCGREAETARAAVAEQLERREQVAAALADAEQLVGELEAELGAFRKRRQELNEEEEGILSQEVRLVEQRTALERREEKHRGDLRCFDSRWRPASPSTSAKQDSQRRPGRPAQQELRRAASAPPRRDDCPLPPAAKPKAVPPTIASEAVQARLREKDELIAELERRLQEKETQRYGFGRADPPSPISVSLTPPRGLEVRSAQPPQQDPARQRDARAPLTVAGGDTVKSPTSTSPPSVPRATAARPPSPVQSDMTRFSTGLPPPPPPPPPAVRTALQYGYPRPPEPLAFLPAPDRSVVRTSVASTGARSTSASGVAPIAPPLRPLPAVPSSVYPVPPYQVPGPTMQRSASTQNVGEALER
eukprot:TRINITY_DN1058_c0_g2_i3.p1 TRINITY_DN1058_c0_g2~~TRINITY_DN1058_c0_g2_i3.p1  ORF type:complete len:1045 (+),score=396.48 TRINITY_DN1058_c0_g2_i3:67-3135(+)